MQRPRFEHALHGLGRKALDALSLAHLRDECKERGIKGFSSMSKDKCIESLLKWKEKGKRTVSDRGAVTGGVMLPHVCDAGVKLHVVEAVAVPVQVITTYCAYRHLTIQPVCGAYRGTS
jgi:hypothetical protein